MGGHGLWGSKAMRVGGKTNEAAILPHFPGSSPLDYYWMYVTVDLQKIGHSAINPRKMWSSQPTSDGSDIL